MKYLLLLLIPINVLAAPCLSPPKDGIRLDEIRIQAINGAAAGEVNLIAAWRNREGGVCCVRTNDSSRQWQLVLSQLINRGDMPLADFAMQITPPGSGQPTPSEQQICDVMGQKITATPPTIPPAVPAIYIIVAPISGKTSRPLYSAAFTEIGRVEFTLNGAPRVCEPTPVLKPGSTIKYYWVTNNAGVRGLAVCKPS